jgi:hypothetical protein
MWIPRSRSRKLSRLGPSILKFYFRDLGRGRGGGAPGLGRGSPGRRPGAGSPVFGCVRGPGGAGGGGLGGR